MLFIALGQTNGRRNSAPHKCRAIEHRTGAWKGAAEGGEEPRRRLRAHTCRRDDDNSAYERASEPREIRGLQRSQQEPVRSRGMRAPGEGQGPSAHDEIIGARLAST